MAITINVATEDFAGVVDTIEALQKKHDDIIVNITSGVKKEEETPKEAPKEEPKKTFVEKAKDWIVNGLNKVTGGSNKGSIRNMLGSRNWTSSREKRDVKPGIGPFDNDWDETKQ